MQQNRLIALDVLRGMTLVLMLIVNNPGDWGHIYAPFEHADWNGCTLTDLVFPFFLFMVGVAVPYALGSRKAAGAADRQLYKKIITRTIMIFLIGLALSGFPYYHLSTMRIPGVLQRIAVVYGVIAILYLNCSFKSLMLVLTIILIGYWMMMTMIPVPGLGYSSLEPETNLGAWLDYKLLHGHLWSQSRVWDPEGMLSTLPAIGTGILGLSAGELLKKEMDLSEKVIILFIAGGILALIGYFWDMSFPINKKLWTSTFVLFTGGLAMMTLGALIYFIDIKKYTRWTKHFIYFGMNSLLVFVGSGILARLLGLIKVGGSNGLPISLKSWINLGYQHEWLDPKISSFLFALTFMMIFYFLLRWVYHKGWFWRM
jgi:predicted acyltransferase